jgi:hypothetical protein
MYIHTCTLWICSLLFSENLCVFMHVRALTVLMVTYPWRILPLIIRLGRFRLVYKDYHIKLMTLLVSLIYYTLWKTSSTPPSPPMAPSSFPFNGGSAVSRSFRWKCVLIGNRCLSSELSSLLEVWMMEQLKNWPVVFVTKSEMGRQAMGWRS